MATYSILKLLPKISGYNLIGGGTSRMAVLILGIKIVIKFPYRDKDKCEKCDREVEVYKRLKSLLDYYLSSLLGYLGRNKYGIILEYAEHRPV